LTIYRTIAVQGCRRVAGHIAAREHAGWAPRPDTPGPVSPRRRLSRGQTCVTTLTCRQVQSPTDKRQNRHEARAGDRHPRRLKVKLRPVFGGATTRSSRRRESRS
jgi:hypothetical protein